MFRKYLFIFFSLFMLGLMACTDSDSGNKETEAHEEETGVTGGVSLTAAQVELMKIEAALPDLRQIEGYISAPARVEPIPTSIADVGTLIPGRVKDIYVVEGEPVANGQVLLEIQSLEIGEIKGEYIRSLAALESAKASFERQEKLLKENIASQRAFIEAQATYEKARAAFIAADQKLHSIGITAKEAQKLVEIVTAGEGYERISTAATLKIYSPISGIVARAAVNVGQQVDPDTDIMEVVDSERVWVVADIYETNLANVKSGQRVEILTEAFPDLVFNGKLEYLSPVVDEESRTVKVRTTIENRNGYLRPEMYATMRIFGSSSQKFIVVPEAAVQNDGEFDFVFVQTEDNEAGERSTSSADVSNGLEENETSMKFLKVPVKAGIQQDGYIQIIAGLTGKEQIVTTGAFFLKSEMMKESFGDDD